MNNEEQNKKLFSPLPRSAEVQTFLETFPNADWKDCLQYVLERFPQQIEGQTQWLLEGGAAIYLMHPRRKEPKDIDLIARFDTMQQQFVNSGKFDVKTAEYWFKMRGMNYAPEVAEFLLNNNVPIEFQGKQILVLSPTGLAASKLLPWGTKPRREQDEIDISLLNVSQKQVDSFIGTIKA